MLSERTGSRTEDGIEDRRDQLLHVLENEPFFSRANSFIAAMAIVVLWDDFSHWKLFSWWAVVAAWNLARLVYANHLRRRIERLASPAAVLRRVTAGAFAAGCIWAAAPLLHPSLHIGHGPIFLVLIAGITAGSAIRGGVFAPGPIAFVSPILIVVAARFMLSGELATSAVVATILFYHWFLVRTTRQQETAYSEMRRLRNEAVRSYDSVQIYKTAMENAPLGMFIATPETTLIRVNPALCEMLGYDAKDLAKEESLTKFVYADDVDAVRDSYRRLLSGESDKERLEVRYLKANGKPIWTYSERTLLREPETGEPKYILGQVKNIEARKRAEAELKRTLRQKNVAVEAAGLGEFIYRFRHMPSGEGVESISNVWSDRLYEIFGVARETFDRSPEAILAAVHPDDRERIDREIRDALLGVKEKYSLEHRIMRPSGDVRHLKVDVNTYRDNDLDCFVQVGAISDVTDYVKVRHRIEEEFERRTIAAEISGLGEVRLDAKTGRIETDHAASVIFGFGDAAAAQFSRQRWTELIHPDDRERVVANATRLLSMERSAGKAAISYRIVRSSGEIRHVKTHSHRMFDTDGGLESVVIAVIDITQEVELAEELKRERRELVEALMTREMATSVAGLGISRWSSSTQKSQWDDRLVEIFGVDQTNYDFTFDAWLALVHPDDHDRVVDEVMAAQDARKPAVFINTRIVRPDETVRHIKVSQSFTYSATGEPETAISAVLDVTDDVKLAESLTAKRHELEEALMRSELATSVAGLGIATVDETERHAHWDERMCEIYGVAGQALPHSRESWLERVHPDDRARIDVEVEKAKRTGANTFSLSHRIVRPDGGIRHVKAMSATGSSEGRRHVTITAVWDVTEYVKLAEDMEAERCKLAAALDRSEVAARAAGLGIASYSASDEFSHWDERTIEIYGVDGERSLFSLEDWMALVHPEDRERVLNEAYRVRESRERFSSIKHRIIRPDGTVRHLTATWAQEFGPNGEWMSTVTAIMDVTEQVELHQALETQKIELQQSLEQKRLAIGIAGLGEYWRDLSSGRRRWSDRLYEIFGVTPNTFDCSKKAVLNALHPGDRKRYEESFRREVSAFRENPTRQEAFGEIAFRILRPSGEVRYLTSYAYLHRVGDSADAIVLMGLVRDRTDEVLARNSLEKDKADLSAALTRASLAANVAGIGVYELDMTEYEAVWDNRFCEILGVDPEIGIPSSQSWLSSIHPDDRQRVADELKVEGAEHHSVEIEYRIIRPTGEIRHLKAASAAICNDSNEMVKMLVVVRDITEEVLLFEEIESERRLLEATLTAIGDAVMRIDPKGRLEYANRTALEMSGKTEGEAIGDKFTSLFHLNGLSAGTLAILGGKNLGASVRNAPAQLLKSSEDAREVELSVEPLARAGDGAIGQVIVLHDVTSLRRSEAELAQSHRLFNVALNHAPIGLSVIDGEGCFSFVNKAMEEICERSAEGMIGEPAARLLSLKDTAQGNVIDFGLVAASDDDAVFEKILNCPSGKEIQTRISVRRVRSGDGKIAFSVVQLQDITAEIRRVTELHEAKELAQVTISSASEGIIRTDENGVITLCNPVAAGFIDADASDLIGRRFAKLYKFTIGARETKIDDPVAVALKRGEPIRMNSTLKLAGKNGVAHRVNLSIAPMIGGDRKVIGAVVLIQDASEIALLTDRLTQQAYTDELTGLGNRRAFEEQLDDCVRAAARRRGRDFLLIIDLDHFKIVNDVCGHGVGDELLGDISQILLSNVRENDFVARIGGDEFGVIMYGADEKSAVRAAEKIIKAVGAYRLNHNNETFQVGASIGLTPVCEGADTSTLMIEADTACYTAKSMGRGRYYVFHANDAAIAETRKSQNWFNRILHGMEEGQFRLFLQQIVSKEKKPVGFEALLRFSEGGKTFGPGAFMDTARRHNMLPKFDRFMFESVVKLLDGEAGESSALKGKYISVNLSASSVADPVFRDWIEKMLDKYAHLTGRLWLELTESDRMRWTDEETAFLRAVRARGVRLYFDDFGTGYNSFDVLKRVEVDGLKLDHSVIRNIIASPIDQALVLASLSITQNLNLEIVAEGVEDRNTFDFLAGIGVKKFQGYLFHKPEEAAKLIKPGKAVRKKAG